MSTTKATNSSYTSFSDGQSSSPAYRYKPVGIVNEFNTCFLNSTFQALSATASLTSLLYASPVSPLKPLPNSILPAPVVPRSQIPSLHQEALEPKLYEKLPITIAFISALHEGYRRKDRYIGDEGCMRLTNMLHTVSAKHPQYNDYDQQDAHEFLRHLLDLMELEEKDAIKILQPKGLPDKGDRTKKRANIQPSQADIETQGLQLQDHISPIVSPLPSPAHSLPVTPSLSAQIDPMSRVKLEDVDLSVVTGKVLTEEPSRNPDEAEVKVLDEGIGDHSVEKSVETLVENTVNEKLTPFVDVLFGGLLASVVVCEKCKAHIVQKTDSRQLSHTYEGFLDISLQMPNEAERPRKRDKVIAFAQRLMPGRSSSSRNSPEIPPTAHIQPPPSALSDNELSDPETNPNTTHFGRRKSVSISEGEGASLGRTGSRKFSIFNRKKRAHTRPGSASSSVNVTPTLEAEKTPTAPPSPVQLRERLHHHRGHHKHQVAPTPAQAAYIARILAPPQVAEQHDPIARLRAAQSGSGPVNNEPTKVETGLERCLREFTSVEVLEGSNAFACHKCWRIKHGRYDHHEATLKEEDENNVPGDSTPSLSTSSGSPLRHPARTTKNSNQSEGTGNSVAQHLSLSSPRLPSSPISIQSGSVSDSTVPRNGHSDRVGRNPSLGSLSSDAYVRANVRTHSPLRRQVEDDDTLVDPMANPRDGSESESDGLSDSESESEDESGKPKKKRKSKHFVMGRAYKRYLIAKSPEVLVFHFKRFKQLSMAFNTFASLKKMDDFVSFPERLDIAPYLAPNRKDYKVSQTPNGSHAPYMDWPNPMQGPEKVESVMYRLYAVVVHVGEMTSGHYVAYVLVDPEMVFGKDQHKEGGDSSETSINDKTLQDDPAERSDTPTNEEQKSTKRGRAPKKDRRVWAFCSDEYIREVEVEEVLSAKAYLCFYEKQH
ncbi:hypothetical protein I309_02379 [Cryptococcus deuterogattii LA55]|nr:hypothetical protein I309_02379 [Cryptococcus deuterogattii LA55]KIR94729.1 hypothetical protein I304_01048 [Cryptococcus deuterogattii CBS 10090]